MTIPTPAAPDRVTRPDRVTGPRDSADPDWGGGLAATHQWRRAHRRLRRLHRRLAAAADAARTRADVAALVEQVLLLRAHQPIPAAYRVLCGAHHAAPTPWPCPMI